MFVHRVKTFVVFVNDLLPNCTLRFRSNQPIKKKTTIIQAPCPGVDKMFRPLEYVCGAESGRESSW